MAEDAVDAGLLERLRDDVGKDTLRCDGATCQLRVLRPKLAKPGIG
jgi:hypothetical protein